jgi:hypothetical protein
VPEPINIFAVAAEALSMCETGHSEDIADLDQLIRDGHDGSANLELLERRRADLAATRAALAVFERLATEVADLRFLDYRRSTNDDRFPQFEMALGSSFVHGGREGVRNDEQHATIKPVDLIETESLLGLLAALECRRRPDGDPAREHVWL